MASPASAPLELLPPTWRNLFYPPEKGRYIYFQHRGSFPFRATNFPEDQRYLIKATWAADAAMLAYGHYSENAVSWDEVAGILRDAGFSQQEPVGDWTPGAQGTQGFFAANDEFAIIAFRGTERGDPKDILSDGDILLSPENSEFLNPCLVHHGFQAALDEVWMTVQPLLESYRKSHPSSELCFTGHSLGAALATIAISRFDGGQASLYTIGSPRVGNTRFCERVLQKSSNQVFRFVNNNDLVTHVPIKAPFYGHVTGFCHRIDPDGRISKVELGAAADFKDLRELLVQLADRLKLMLDLSIKLEDKEAPPNLVDHSPARYCMRLRNLLGGIQPLAAKAAGEG